jgi:hypothetical protein
METELLAQVSHCTGTCGWMVLAASMVLFPGSVWLLTSSVFGTRMGYLISATGFFAFMVILSSLWVFGAPGTPRYLGPKGDLPAWKAVAAGPELTSSSLPLIEQYPEGPWKTAKEAGLKTELEPASLAFADFLAEEATAELKDHGIDGEVAPESFTVDHVEFAELKEGPVAMARAFNSQGGPEVLVFGYKDPGNEPVPSYFAFVLSLIGFGAHLPFLDRAERKRKDVLTGGSQPPFRGPA